MLLGSRSWPRLRHPPGSVLVQLPVVVGRVWTAAEARHGLLRLERTGFPSASENRTSMISMRVYTYVCVPLSISEMYFNWRM